MTVAGVLLATCGGKEQPDGKKHAPDPQANNRPVGLQPDSISLDPNETLKPVLP